MVNSIECFCSNSYIGQTSRHIETRTKMYISKCVKEHLNNQPKTISIATLIAINRSWISEHVIKVQFVDKFKMKQNLKY